MKFETFRTHFGKQPYFTLQDVLRHPVAKGVERVQLSHWVKAGKVLRLKKGIYALADALQDKKTSAWFLAEVLYPPSYISLHTALSYYGMIPEAVFSTTCISTRKTKKFKNTLGSFEYRHLAPAHFFGFTRCKENSGNSYLMATPEKALLDFIYLEIPYRQILDRELYEDSYRFAHFEQLSNKILTGYMNQFHSPKLCKALPLLLALCKEHQHD